MSIEGFLENHDSRENPEPPFLGTVFMQKELFVCLLPVVSR